MRVDTYARICEWFNGVGGGYMRLPSDRCQHCGQRLPQRGLPEGVRFSRLRQAIWEAVTSWPGMSAQEIMDWVYGHREDGGPESVHNISVNIHHMNKQLQPYGLTIAGQKYYGYHIRQLKED